jgi:Zn-dependent protease with chaperone function
MDALTVITVAWLVWAALCTVSTLAAPLFAARPDTPWTNGLFIVVPDAIRRRLDPDELAALIEHERGHRARLHAVENLVRTWFFIRRSARRAAQQEFEADDYAAARINPETLARAIRRLSGHPFDLHRAHRLEANARQACAPAA